VPFAAACAATGTARAAESAQTTKRRRISCSVSPALVLFA
jgi:hypothetical protein